MTKKNHPVSIKKNHSVSIRRFVSEFVLFWVSQYRVILKLLIVPVALIWLTEVSTLLFKLFYTLPMERTGVVNFFIQLIEVLLKTGVLLWCFVMLHTALTKLMLLNERCDALFHFQWTSSHWHVLNALLLWAAGSFFFILLPISRFALFVAEAYFAAKMWVFLPSLIFLILLVIGGLYVTMRFSLALTVAVLSKPQAFQLSWKLLRQDAPFFILGWVLVHVMVIALSLGLFLCFSFLDPGAWYTQIVSSFIDTVFQCLTILLFSTYTAKSFSVLVQENKPDEQG